MSTLSLAGLTVELVRPLNHRSDEEKLLQVLGAVDSDTLNFILCDTLAGGVPVAQQLIHRVDNRLVGPDNKTALFQLLTEEKVTELTAASKGALLRAIQRHHSKNSVHARAIKALFLAATPTELTWLKRWYQLSVPVFPVCVCLCLDSAPSLFFSFPSPSL